MCVTEVQNAFRIRFTIYFVKSLCLNQLDKGKLKILPSLIKRRLSKVYITDF